MTQATIQPASHDPPTAQVIPYRVVSHFLEEYEGHGCVSGGCAAWAGCLLRPLQASARPPCMPHGGRAGGPGPYPQPSQGWHGLCACAGPGVLRPGCAPDPAMHGWALPTGPASARGTPPPACSQACVRRVVSRPAVAHPGHIAAGPSGPSAAALPSGPPVVPPSLAAPPPLPAVSRGTLSRPLMLPDTPPPTKVCCAP